jgi:hypothetical protein
MTTAKRRPTLTTDDEMLRLVEGWLREPKPKPVKEPKYYWMYVLEAFWPQLSKDNCVVKITPADERGLADRQAWRIDVLTDAAPNGIDHLTREGFLRWVEDRIRTPPMPLSLTDEDLQRWLTVFKARREALKQKPKRSWKETFQMASNQLKNTPAAGKLDSMERSYKKVHRQRLKGSGGVKEG